MTEDKIDNLIKKLSDLRDKLSKMKYDYDLKESKIRDKARLIEEKIFSLRVKMLEDKEVPKALEYYLGIRWVNPDIDEVSEEYIYKDLTKDEVKEEEKFQEAANAADDELGIEFLE